MLEKPRFIADAMLGSLAKWLRILGFDTLYFKIIDDNELIKIARQEQRIILTRDTHLVKRKGIGNYFLISSNDTLKQLKEVLRMVCSKHGAADIEEGAYCLLPTTYFSPRCAKCNGELLSAGRESVVNDVPEHVFLNFNSFLKCKDCGKVYWGGSHKKIIDTKIHGVLKR